MYCFITQVLKVDNISVPSVDDCLHFTSKQVEPVRRLSVIVPPRQGVPLYPNAISEWMTP
jgi:hypothetical protein